MCYLLALLYAYLAPLSHPATPAPSVHVMTYQVAVLLYVDAVEEAAPTADDDDNKLTRPRGRTALGWVTTWFDWRLWQQRASDQLTTFFTRFVPRSLYRRYLRYAPLRLGEPN